MVNSEYVTPFAHHCSTLFRGLGLCNPDRYFISSEYNLGPIAKEYTLVPVLSTSSLLGPVICT